MKKEIEKPSFAMEIIRDLKKELNFYKILTTISVIGIVLLLIILYLHRG